MTEYKETLLDCVIYWWNQKVYVAVDKDIGINTLKVSVERWCEISTNRHVGLVNITQWHKRMLK